MREPRVVLAARPKLVVYDSKGSNMPLVDAKSFDEKIDADYCAKQARAFGLRARVYQRDIRAGGARLCLWVVIIREKEGAS